MDNIYQQILKKASEFPKKGKINFNFLQLWNANSWMVRLNVNLIEKKISADHIIRTYIL